MSDDLSALIRGFAEFKASVADSPDSDYHELVKLGQQPSILVIACSDSRVDPAIITNCKAGDMLVVRNIANLVPPYSGDDNYLAIKAAVELAIAYLKVKHIIVMGHSRCGGVRTLINRLKDNTDPSHPLEAWTQIAEPAALSVIAEQPDIGLEDWVCACSRRAVAISLKNLESYPWVRDAQEKGSLSLHGWYFNLASAELEALDRASGDYYPLC